VVRAKTTEEAHATLLDPRHAVGALVIPPDLPAFDLRGALSALRRLSPQRRLRCVATGLRPGPERRCELADAGTDLAAWEPIDAHALRFQMNRALRVSAAVPPPRSALRAPVAWRAQIRQGRRCREARVYTISATGAFLATPRPAPRGAGLVLELPLPNGFQQVASRVVMTNVPGNLRTPRLPIGMAVCFERPGLDVEAALQLHAEERLRALAL
jgi:hypothetical protein